MKAVFLDRDGVINSLVFEDGYLRSPRKMNEFRYIDGIKGFVWNLKKCNYEIITVTNQPEVKRGLVSKKQVEEFHNKIKIELGIPHFYVCWHDDTDRCECRKPRPGLLIQASNELRINLQKSILIGDREKDMLAAENAGCKGILFNNNILSFDKKGYDNFDDILRIIKII